MRAERSVFKWVQPVVDRIVSLGHQASSLCLPVRLHDCLRANTSMLAVGGTIDPTF